MSAAIAGGDSAAMTAIVAFLANILPAGLEIVQGLDNDVPMPAGPDFVILTPIRRERLATNEDAWPFANAAAIASTAPIRLTVQIDVYGPASPDNAVLIATALRSAYACDFLAAAGLSAGADVQPLHADDAAQKPFTNAESQYERRWGLDAAFQVNPVVSVPQDFAAAVTVAIPAPAA